MILNIALKSLLNRKLTVVLTIFCVALSVVLLLSLQKIKTATEEGFTQTVSQVDLLVGARGGSLQLLLFTVFNVGQPNNNVSWKSYQNWKQHPAIDWTIPYSLGDSYRGFRVVATDQNFFDHYRYRHDQAVKIEQGRRFEKGLEVVLGHEAYKELKLKEGDKTVITHGVTHGAGVVHHDEQPFTVVGIMERTGTALDHSVYIPLDAMELLHVDPKSEAKASHKENHKHDDGHDHHHHDENDIHSSVEVKSITSFFVRTKNRVETLKLQREIAESTDEPLTAVIPAMALSELWRNLSYFERILQAIIWLVAIFSWVTLMLMMLSSLESRRREMALLRAMGASPSLITILLAIEAGVIGLCGVILGLILSRLGLIYFGGFLKEALGLQMNPLSFEIKELYLMIATLAGCIVVSCIPSLRANRQALKDGLTVKS